MPEMAQGPVDIRLSQAFCVVKCLLKSTVCAFRIGLICLSPPIPAAAAQALPNGHCHVYWKCMHVLLIFCRFILCWCLLWLNNPAAEVMLDTLYFKCGTKVLHTSSITYDLAIAVAILHAVESTVIMQQTCNSLMSDTLCTVTSTKTLIYNKLEFRGLAKLAGFQ